MEETFITKEQERILRRYKRELLGFLLEGSQYTFKKHKNKIIRELIRIEDYLIALESHKDLVYNLEFNK